MPRRSSIGAAPGAKPRRSSIGATPGARQLSRAAPPQLLLPVPVLS